MEEVVIETQLLMFTDSIIKVEMKMWNADKTVLKSIFWNTFVYFDIKLQKKTEHSQDLIDLFTEIVNPIEETIFEKRVYAIISANKAAKLAKSV
jgi:acyl-CoA thioester hydrolase